MANFSVIVPLHNKRPHVTRALQSVLSQTFSDFELIVVNDASTDGSEDEVLKFNDNRIRLVHRTIPGPGGYAARNFGIANATGRWIAFLDADDEWVSDHLSRMASLSALYPDCHFLSCGWNTLTPDGHLFSNYYYTKYYAKGPHTISLIDYLSNCSNRRQPTCTIVSCLEKAYIPKSLFPDGKALRGGDLYAWLTCLADMKTIAWSPHIGATYYRNSVNMITKTTPSNPHIYKDMFERILPSLNEKERIYAQKYINRLVWECFMIDALNNYKKQDYMSCFDRSNDWSLYSKFWLALHTPEPIVAKSLELKGYLRNHVYKAVNLSKKQASH